MSIDRPTPWRVGTPHCGAYDTTGFVGIPRQRSGAVTRGTVAGGEPVEGWLAFACST